jgi:hypothetical protein
MGSTVQIQKGRFFRCQKQGFIQVMKGELWITVAGDREDYVLSENQHFSHRDQSLLVAEALTDSEIEIKYEADHRSEHLNHSQEKRNSSPEL